MNTLIKWPGGKERELPIIEDGVPEYSGRYIEPFVGGGALFFDTEGKDCFINDKSWDLINFYKCISSRDKAFAECLDKEYDSLKRLTEFVDKNSTELLDLYLMHDTTEDFLKRNEILFCSIAVAGYDIFYKELDKNLKSKIRKFHS